MAKLIFADKKPTEPPGQGSRQPPWRTLVVDDDPEVHSVTELALRNLVFRGRGIELLHAESGAQARDILAEKDNIALVLLDVVMETDDAGLTVIEHVRNQLNNRKVRIVLRTGQPGQAPENDVILRYEINDYKSKTELTQQKLFSTVITALRGYEDLMLIEASRQGLLRIIDASASLLRMHSLQAFAGGVLTQLSGLLGSSGGGILATRRLSGSGAADLVVVGSSGRFAPGVVNHGDRRIDPTVDKRLYQAMNARQSIVEPDYTILYISANSEREVAIYLEISRALDVAERALLEIFGANIAACFDNIQSIEEIVRSNQTLRDRIEQLLGELEKRKG